MKSATLKKIRQCILIGLLLLSGISYVLKITDHNSSISKTRNVLKSASNPIAFHKNPVLLKQDQNSTSKSNKETNGRNSAPIISQPGVELHLSESEDLNRYFEEAADINGDGIVEGFRTEKTCEDFVPDPAEPTKECSYAHSLYLSVGGERHFLNIGNYIHYVPTQPAIEIFGIREEINGFLLRFETIELDPYHTDYWIEVTANYRSKTSLKWSIQRPGGPYPDPDLCVKLMRIPEPDDDTYDFFVPFEIDQKSYAIKDPACKGCPGRRVSFDSEQGRFVVKESFCELNRK